MQHANIWTKSLAPDILDFVLIFFYLSLIFFISQYIRKRNIEKNPEYRFYTTGLFVSIFGAVVLGIVYTVFYSGGDTTGYFRSSLAMVNLLFQDPVAYFRILFGDLSPEAISSFSSQTGRPWYTHDRGSFAVVRITSIFSFFGAKNYYTTSILFVWFFYSGCWKLYSLFCHFYKDYYKQIAIAVLFFPSVVFWGSGILKDSIVLSAMGWFIYSIYFLLWEKKNKLLNLIIVIISGYFLILIKPYIFVALLPAISIWASWTYIIKIKNRVVRWIISPLLLLIFSLISISVMFFFQESLGSYGTIDGILQKAIITYEDHIRYEQYGTHFYDLGEFDGTLINFISKAPKALIASLFRPFLWESRSILMLFSGIENFLILSFLILLFLKRGIIKFFSTIAKEPFIVFSIVFTLIFAFAIGVTSGNFGALVRLKIPMIPFFIGSLIIIYFKLKKPNHIKTNQSDFM